MQKVNGKSLEPPKEYCCHPRCNMSFGLAEPRVAVGLGKVMHEDCYLKHLRDAQAATETKFRIH